MDDLLKDIKLYGASITNNQYLFYVSKTKLIKDGVLNEDPILASFLYRNIKYPVKKCILFYNLVYPNKVDKKKYEGYGLATAIIMLQFLFALSSFDSTLLRTTSIKRGRKGQMYTLLGMKKKWKWLPPFYLFYPLFPNYPFFFQGEYDKRAVEILKKNPRGVKLSKNVLTHGVTLLELMETYKKIGNELKQKGLELGKLLLNAVAELEKRIS